MQVPEKIQTRRLADYLNVLTRAAFQARMHWQVIKAEGPRFPGAFHQFDPERVAARDLDAIDGLVADPSELLTVTDVR